MEATAPAQLLGIEDTCKALGVGRTSVYALLTSGELKSIKIGRRTLVPAIEVAAYIERAMSAA